MIVMSLVDTKPYRAPVESVHLLKAITLESSRAKLNQFSQALIPLLNSFI